MTDPLTEVKAISAERQAARVLRQIAYTGKVPNTAGFLEDLADRLATDAERRTLKMTGAV